MKFIRELPRFSSPRLRLVPWALPAALFLPLFVSQNVFGHASSRGDPCKDLLPVLDEVTGWLSSRRPLPSGAEDESAAFGVISPWPFGHYLHVSERPRGDRSLQLRVRAGPANDRRAARIWGAGTVPELSSVMRRYRARYLVLMSPAYDIAKIAAPDSPHANELIRWRPATDNSSSGP